MSLDTLSSLLHLRYIYIVTVYIPAMNIYARSIVNLFAHNATSQDIICAPNSSYTRIMKNNCNDDQLEPSIPHHLQLVEIWLYQQYLLEGRHICVFIRFTRFLCHLNARPDIVKQLAQVLPLYGDARTALPGARRRRELRDRENGLLQEQVHQKLNVWSYSCICELTIS